jgi:hypothetical protein
LIPEKPLQWSGNFVFNGGTFQEQVASENGGLMVSYEDSGIVKVTFGSNPASYVGSIRNEGTNDQVISESIVPGANDLSYTIELVASQSGG